MITDRQFRANKPNSGKQIKRASIPKCLDEKHHGKDALPLARKTRQGW